MADEPSANGRPKVRRLTLVEDQSERLIGGQAAVRRYRLARLERVAEETPVEGAPVERSGDNGRSGVDEGVGRRVPPRPTS